MNESKINKLADKELLIVKLNSDIAVKERVLASHKNRVTYLKETLMEANEAYHFAVLTQKKMEKIIVAAKLNILRLSSKAKQEQIDAATEKLVDAALTNYRPIKEK